MKPHQATNKLGKRTYTLKELAQRNFVSPPQVVIQDKAPRFNPVNIQEDLLDEVETIEVDQKNHHAAQNQQQSTPASLEQSKTNISSTNLTVSIELINHLITKEIGLTAKTLGLEENELQAWIDLQVMAPKQTLLALLRLARANNLDPLQEEVALALYEDSHWQAYITVEGYSKMLNRHPAFDGMSFTQSEETTNGIPIWMECTIYRKDRSNPISVREYFEEIKGEQAIWQKMPRRMLRHKVMQQCARLAII
ncbi:recombinase RecT [Polynucleobacter sp.]|uniref:recombinase RecT n=1 Tax=Polynucleobacter sp. TaxID=2029855 RepID=UPI0026221774|nr:recombinase RecT [Polynucleobacter sp.]MCW1966048.1 recombinase RecT [Polynucleobacter sp.]